MENNLSSRIKRIQIFNVLLIFVFSAVLLKLFYLQVIQRDYYAKQAEGSQLKQFDIPADRGNLYAYDGTEIVPLVLNETRYRIVADPEIIKDVGTTARELAQVLSLPENELKQKLNADSRYQILANKQEKKIKEAVDALRLPGIFTNEKVPLRVYVQGSIAAQILGFVNDDGVGNYGLEQYFDEELRGTPGRVKALTDKNNIPLLATEENLLTDPVNGKDMVLTIDVALQRQIETILKEGLDNARSDSGSIIIMNPKNGAIKAMASYPTYDPANFSQVEDAALFINPAISEPLEPGSIMKTLTAAAALDAGVVTDGQTYYDPSYFQVDDAVVRNIEENGGAGTRSVSDILQYSLNTGATWLLMQMGGGELNEQGRKVWHDYMVNHYRFGQKTGIEQGYEAEGVIPDPVEGYGLNIRYANSSFGQGMTVTPIQMVAALAAAVNGGTYYKPTLISGSLDETAVTPVEPEILASNVIKKEASDTLVRYMNNVVDNNNPSADREGYQVGGKTGTAQIARPEGGYYEDQFNGTYVGYVGGESPEYVVMVRVNKPKIDGYAGFRAAAPIFSRVSNTLIDNFTVFRTTN